MSVSDPTNEWYTTAQQSGVTARPRQGVVLHHGATTSMDAILAMEISGSRQVSSNRAVKDGRCARVVSDDPNIRAWSLSDAFWDSVLSSVECANESTAGWTISDASHETLARYVAYRAQQEGWHPHRDGDPSSWTVIGHREVYTIHGGSYATACPGGMDLDRITRRAQQLLGSGGDDDMPKFYQATAGDGHNYGFIMQAGLGFRISESQEVSNRLAVDYGGPVAVGDDNALNTVFWPAGFPDGWIAFNKAVDAFKKTRQPVWNYTPALVALMTAGTGGGSGGTTDLQPVLDAIAAGELQDAKDLQAILTAVGNGDEETLKRFQEQFAKK